MSFITIKCQECGKEEQVYQSQKKKYCSKDCYDKNKYKDISEKKFGKLKAIKRVGVNKHRKSIWKCRCECGNKSKVVVSNLMDGSVSSCGCQKIIKESHKMSGTKFYRVWIYMKERCENENSTGYKYYGARGIKVCDRWQDFENFRDDMYESYKEHKKNYEQTTIERINNEGDYRPENCTWATMSEQMQNKRRSVKV